MANAYTNTVGIMPGAATEKLPFIHSDFKARSKMNKYIGGFRCKYRQNIADVVPKHTLPQIYYSGGDRRNLVTWGSKARGGPIYPGFTGKRKILKKKDHPTLSSGSTAHILQNDKTNCMKSYLSLPNLNVLHNTKHGGKSSTFVPTECNEQQSTYTIDDYDENRLFNSAEGTQLLDSLIIVDDDNVGKQNVHYQGGLNSINNKNTVKFIGDAGHPCSPAEIHTTPKIDPFTRGVDEKLREDRGKSGMKRDRIKRRESDHVRILGDVVTAQRMHELLRPRKEGEDFTLA